MLVVQVRRDAARFGIRSERLRCHGGDFFYDYSYVRCFGGRGAPAKGRVSGDENSGLMQWVELCESPNDGMAGICFVIRANLRRGKGLGHWNGAMEVIGGCGAEARNFALGLSPGRSRSRVCVRHASDGG